MYNYLYKKSFTKDKDMVLKKAIEYKFERIDKKDISIAQLARELGYSRSWLSRLYKRYKNNQPLEKARGHRKRKIFLIKIDFLTNSGIINHKIFFKRGEFFMSRKFLVVLCSIFFFFFFLGDEEAKKIAAEKSSKKQPKTNKKEKKAEKKASEKDSEKK